MFVLVLSLPVSEVVVWMRRVPHMLKYLNTWFPVGSAVWRGLRGLQPCWKKYVAGRSLRVGFESSQPHPTSSSVPCCDLSASCSCCLLSGIFGKVNPSPSNRKPRQAPPVTCARLYLSVANTGQLGINLRDLMYAQWTHCPWALSPLCIVDLKLPQRWTAT